MLLRGMLSDIESETLKRSKLERYGPEDAVRVHDGYELGVITKEYLKIPDVGPISEIVKKNNLNSTSGRREISLRISLEVNGLLQELADKAGVSKIAVVRALLFLRGQQIIRNQQMNGSKSVLNLATWNTDWFRNKKRSGEDWEYLESDCDQESYVRIVAHIKAFLERKHAAFFLQEVPYQIKDGNIWRSAQFYQQLLHDFPDSEYEICSFIPNPYCLRVTAAIYKKGAFRRDASCTCAGNRIVSLRRGDVTLLGVHMPVVSLQKENWREADKMWTALIHYAQSKKKAGEKLIILGDFNAYIGCHEEGTEKRYIELCRVAKDIVSDDTPTFVGATAIDHVLLTFDSKQAYKVSIEPQFQWSDHKYIQVELTL